MPLNKEHINAMIRQLVTMFQNLEEKAITTEELKTLCSNIQHTQLNLSLHVLSGNNKLESLIKTI